MTNTTLNYTDCVVHVLQFNTLTEFKKTDDAFVGMRWDPGILVEDLHGRDGVGVERRFRPSRSPLARHWTDAMFSPTHKPVNAKKNVISNVSTHAWSTKWSLFTKFLHRWAVNRETNLLSLVNSWSDNNYQIQSKVLQYQNSKSFCN